MLKGKDVPTKLWEEVVNRTCCISKRVYLKLGTHRTPYEIWKGKKPNLKHLREFGSSCNMLNDKEPRGKFYAKRDEGFFLGYCTNSSVYRVYNKRAKTVMESINV